MRNNPPFEPSEEDIPEGWEPELDSDQSWKMLVAMMQEAEEPSALPPAVWEATKLDVRRRLIAEGVLHSGTIAPQHGEESFGQWLKSLLLGGGFPAQVLRFGAVGGFSFLLGMQLFVAEPIPVEETMPNTVVAEAPLPTKVTQPEVKPTATFQGPGSKEIVQTSGDFVWESVDTMWRNQRTIDNTYARPVSTSSAERGLLANNAVDQLQGLKLQFYAHQDDGEMLNRITQLEDTLAQLLKRDQYPLPKVQTLEVFGQANAHISNGRFDQAIHDLNSVIRLDPGSNVALNAQFLIAKLAFEKTFDYELAEAAFRQCLIGYPDQRISSNQRGYINDRLEILTTTRAEGWKTLRLWQDAQLTNDPATAVDHLVKVVANSPSTALVADSAQRLENYLVRDNALRQLNSESISQVLEERAATMSGEKAGLVWWSLAEITAIRQHQLDRAAEFYRAVLDCQPNEQITTLVKLRLQSLSQLDGLR